MTSEAVPTARGPSLGVILVAHDRREFLLQALDSVRAPPSGPPPEIIVVKNYEDAALDEKLHARGARTLLVTDPGAGSKYAAAAAASTAEVLLFLEDDDLFHAEKLARVQELFQAHPDLGYLHHNVRPVDRAGAPVPEEAFRPADVLGLRRLGRLIVPQGPGRWPLLRTLRTDPAFNASAIAVRRRVLEPHLDTLRRIRNIPDTFLFYAAVISGASLCLDGSPWTDYRIHGGNASLGAETSAVEYLARLSKFSSDLLESLSAIRDMVARSGDKDALELVEGLVAAQELFATLRDARQGRREMRKALRSFGRWKNTYAWNVHHRAHQLGLLFLLSPGLARRLYVGHRLRERDLAAGA